MLILVTGLPGNGKTLYALTWVKAKAEKEGRPVYYSGITDLRLPWTELPQGEDWHKCPANSIVVIDEAQRIFRPRMHGSVVPEHVKLLETHRHLGIDLVIITQHPMLVDSNVRRLVGLHFHLMRKFGTQASTVHEWSSVKESCDKNRDDSVRHEFLFPKANYGLYKSAEVHTHKARLPAKLLWLVIAPLGLVGAAYMSYRYVEDKYFARTTPAVPAASPGGPGGAAPAASPPGRPSRDARPVLTAAEYVEQHQPRVAGLAYTAPVYDAVTVPVVAPYPAACVVMHRFKDGDAADECRCYSQQATRLEVPAALCNDIAARGFFISWEQRLPPAPPPSLVSKSSGTPESVQREQGPVPAASVISAVRAPLQVSEAQYGGGAGIPPGVRPAETAPQGRP